MGVEAKAVDEKQDEIIAIKTTDDPPDSSDKTPANEFEPDDVEEGVIKDGEGKTDDTEDGKSKDEGKVEEGKGKGEEKEEVTLTPEQIAQQARDQELLELKQLAREQKRELDKYAKDLEKATEALKKAELIPGDDPEVTKKLEETQALKLQSLETMLEIMELNPKFEDVREVVSQRHFDDMVEAMAKYIVNNEGGKLNQRVVEVETTIWGMANPYKYMYEKIKQFHPDYMRTVKKNEDDGSGTKDGEKKTEDKIPPKIPGSIHNIPGASSGQGGWTAAMIDALDELELGKVPKDVYQKYLMNELK